MHLDEQRLQLACLPGAIAFPAPTDCHEVAPSEREFHRGPLSPLMPLLILPPLGWWGLATIAVTGDRRVSSAAWCCHALLALAGGIRLLAYVPRLHRNVAYP